MNEKRFDLVVVGEINPDLILSGDVEPVFGQVEKLVDGLTLTVGASSSIFACGAARLGLRTAFIGKVGQDEFGRFMKDALRQRCVDVSGVVEDSQVPTGISVILSKGNDRAILTYPGTIPRLRFCDISEEIVAQARHLHMAGYFILDDLRPEALKVFSQARRLGLSTSLDTNYDPSQKWDGGLDELLDMVDVFLPNEVECCAIAGAPDLDEAMQALSNRVGVVVVKQGERGARLRRGQETYVASIIPVEVVDTVGAGDSFDGGFLYGYLAGWDLARSLRLATICGCLSTQKAGGINAQPTLGEALAYL